MPQEMPSLKKKKTNNYSIAILVGGAYCTEITVSLTSDRKQERLGQENSNCRELCGKRTLDSCIPKGWGRGVWEGYFFPFSDELYTENFSFVLLSDNSLPYQPQVLITNSRMFF